MFRVFLKKKINDRVSSLREALKNNPSLALGSEIESLEDISKLLNRNIDADLSDIESVSPFHYCHHFEMSFDTAVPGKSLKDLRTENGNRLDTIIGFKPVVALDSRRNNYVTVLDRELF